MGTYIVVGYLLEMLIGKPAWLPHPKRLIGKLMAGLESIILSKFRTKIVGVLLAFFTVVLTYLITELIMRFAGAISPFLYAIVCSILIFYTLSVRTFSDRAMKVYKALQEDDCVLAREKLAYLVKRDTQGLNEEGIIRGTVETAARNTVNGVIAPFFYIFLGGPALGMAYMAVNTMNSRLGYRDEEYKELSWATAKLNDIVNWLPARIAGFIIPLAAGVWGKDTKEGMKMYNRDKNKHLSLNDGHPKAAMAGVLGVRLGGPHKYLGQIIEKPFYGDPKKSLGLSDILDASRIMKTTAFLGLVAFYLIAMKFGFR